MLMKGQGCTAKAGFAGMIQVLNRTEIDKMKEKRCTQSNCRRFFKMSGTDTDVKCPYCGYMYMRIVAGSRTSTVRSDSGGEKVLVILKAPDSTKVKVLYRLLGRLSKSETEEAIKLNPYGLILVSGKSVADAKKLLKKQGAHS